jgi:hypothetical protein
MPVGSTFGTDNPDRHNKRLLEAHVSPDVSRETIKEKVPRPAHVEKVAMTTHVMPDERLFYKIWAAQFGTNMQDMQGVALRLVKARLESVPERERSAMWEAIKKEVAQRS